MIADSKTESLAAKALTMETARKRDAGESVTMAAAAANTSLQRWSAASPIGRCRSLAAPATWPTISHGIERLYRDVRIFRIYEGTSQIQQVVIARETLKRGG